MKRVVLRTGIRELFAIASLVTIILLVYLKLLLPTSMEQQRVWYDHCDMCELEIPRLQFVAREIATRGFPLWDPNMWSGQPVIGQAQPGLVYPLNLLFLFAASSPEGLTNAALNCLFLSVHFIAAFLLYLLCRDHGLGRASSISGGVLFSVLGFLGSAPWLDVANGVSLAPAIMLFTFRLATRRMCVRDSLWLGFVIGMSWLTGHHEIPLICGLIMCGAIGCVFVWRAITLRQLEFTVLASAGAALSVGLAIAAVQLFPLMEFGEAAKRWAGAPEPLSWGDRVPYAVHAQYSLAWRDLIEVLVPPSSGVGSMLFSGVTAVTLSLTAIVAGRRSVLVKGAVMIAVVGTIYALGGNTPIHRVLYEIIPFLDKARNPARGGFLLSISISILAAVALVIAIRKELSSVSLRRWLSLGSVLAVMSLLVVCCAQTSWNIRFYPLYDGRRGLVDSACNLLIEAGG
ncbi:MAG: hypothetical protein HY820_36390 [Acidobacteria bacterium]|nr:hypothetical protein [Acidobacteriota bacterium]